VLGALGLFGIHVGALPDEDLSLAQALALAHVGSVALVDGPEVADPAAISEQLQSALNSRVVLEQAKGLVAQLGDLDMDQAFGALRRYAATMTSGSPRWREQWSPVSCPRNV
jgi:ANTAR domain-containing protein